MKRSMWKALAKVLSEDIMKKRTNIEKHIEAHRAMCDEKKVILGEGAWQHEPHRVEFQANGLQCLLLRSPVTFAWCGYVGVSKSHPLYGVHYDNLNSIDIDIHGGLTYAAKCRGPICHQADIDDEAKLHWFGFDCAHWGDYSPTIQSYKVLEQVKPELYQKLEIDQYLKGKIAREHYWTMQEVMVETTELAEKLAIMGG